MSELLGITIADLVERMKERKVRIPSEIGAFIALEVCESLRDGPAAPSLHEVRVADDGTISVFAPPGSATSEDGAKSVVTLLGSLLVAAGTGVPRVLVGLLEEGPTSGRWDLSSLRDDLEASLVPLNRAAARRVLSRMLRDVRKPRSNMPVEAPPPRDVSLDAQLDDLLGGDSAPPAARRSPAAIDDLDDLDDLDRELDATLDELSAPASARAAAPRAAAPARPRSERPPPKPSRPQGPRASLDDVPSEPDDATIADEGLPASLSEPPRKPRPRPDPEATLDPDALADLPVARRGSALPWALAFFAIVAATAAAFALMRPDLVDALLGRPPPPEVPTGPTEEEQAAALAAHRAQFGTLSVRVLPEQSQVLLFVGRGPATADELPIGVAHEFVAIADGRTPSRMVLPYDAEWEATDDGRRYELALQTGDEEMAAADLALGPTRLQRDALGSPSTELGQVRVITSPPGAKVYLLVGFSPDVTVENVRTQEAVELIAYHEGHPVLRHLVGPSDWSVGEDGLQVATVELTLEGYEPEDE